MRRWLYALALLLPFPAAAQYQVVASCGTPPATLVAGQQVPGYVDLTGVVCTAGSGGGTTTNVVTNSTTSSVTTNFSTINNVAMDVGGGSKGNGTLRVTLATDQTQLTSPLLTQPYSATASWVTGHTTSTDGSAHTIIASAGGSLKNYVTGVQCGRTDTGASAVTVAFNDSATTTLVLPAAGANFAGSGNNATFNPPIATAAATAFQMTVSSGVSTVHCSAQGYTGT